MKKSDTYRLERIAEIGRLLEQTLEEEQITKESLQDNYRHQWLVTTPLYNIGEQAYCLSRELKASHPEVEWSGISGLRHRLVHDYEGTNWSMVASIVLDDLPTFLEQVDNILVTLASDSSQADESTPQDPSQN